MYTRDKNKLNPEAHYTDGIFIPLPYTIPLVYQCRDHAQMAEVKFRLRAQKDQIYGLQKNFANHCTVVSCH